jgi:hypothetical protein
VRRQAVVRSPSLVWGLRNSAGLLSLLAEGPWGQVADMPAGR